MFDLVVWKRLFLARRRIYVLFYFFQWLVCFIIFVNWPVYLSDVEGILVSFISSLTGLICLLCFDYFDFKKTLEVLYE